MPPLQQRNGTAGDGDSLILTPSKLRLHSCVFGPYITCLWLPNAVLASLLLLKASDCHWQCSSATGQLSVLLLLTRLNFTS